MRVDLNADIGESFGIYRTGNDLQLLPCISSGSIACGFHAGDPTVMRETVRLAARHEVAIGAHPGFPDLAGFGRREMNIDPAGVADLVLYQLGALAGMVRAEGARVQHVKPHGALYNLSMRKADIAEAVARAVASFDQSLLLVGLPDSELLSAGARLGLHVVAEGFADRSYESDGTLTPRQFEDAVLVDGELAAERAVRMVKDRRVVTRDGTTIRLKVDTICVHGDTPDAAAIARSVRQALTDAGVRILAMGAE